MLGTEDDAGSIELSEAVEAVLGEEVHVSEAAQAVLDQVERGLNDPLPVFEGQNASMPMGAEATRIAFPDESLSSASEDDAGLDDLFVELIEE